MVALNLSYDVSVKIWSMNLLALSFVLIAPDLRRLVTVTTAGATRLAYNPYLIDVRFEQAIEADPDAGLMLAFSRRADDRLVLTGQWESDSISVQLKRIDESRFLLLNRGFHWTQYSPFFR